MCGGSANSGGSGGNSGNNPGPMKTKDDKYRISKESNDKAYSKDQNAKESGESPNERYWQLERFFNSGGLKMNTKDYNFTKDRNPQEMAKLRERAIKEIMGKDYNKVDEDVRLPF
jgi:hypothetical protein